MIAIVINVTKILKIPGLCELDYFLLYFFSKKICKNC